MHRERRTMKRGDKYQIEEKESGEWKVKHELSTIEGVKKLLQILKEQDKED